MKKLGYVVAALGAVAAPTLASAETVIVKHGHHGYGARAEMREHHDNGWHRGWHHHDRVVMVRHGHHHMD